MTKRINKIQAVNLIKSSKGKFFTVTFKTRNNLERTINCNTKISTNNPNDLGYFTVNSISDKGYRTINSQTISKISINGLTYNVR